MTEIINRARKTKLREGLFWIGLGVSCLWFSITCAADVFLWSIVLRDGYLLGPAWALILLIPSIALPTIVGWGIVSAIRYPNKNTGERSLSRALAPLWTLAASVVLLGAITIYVKWAVKQLEQQRRTGSITFNCVERSQTGERVGSGSIKLRLTQLRRQKGFGDWTINWPEKSPIKAESFEAHTGSLGGSQGLRWREIGGKEIVALVSFSDVIADFGTSDLDVSLVSGPLTSAQAKIDAGEAIFYVCNPDPKSWRE